MTENEQHVPLPLSQRISAPAVVAEPRRPLVDTWRPATPTDVDAIMVFAAACDAVDHPTFTTARDEVEELFELDHHDPARFTRVGLDAEGRILALASVMIHPSQDVHVNAFLSGRVHPQWRRRGIGREVLRWEDETVRSALTELDTTLPAAVFLYAEERDAGVRVLGAESGMVEERWFTTMLRDMSEPIADVSPAGDSVQIVALTPDLIESTRLARNDAFRDHWGSLDTPPDRWARFTSGEHFRADLSRVAVDDGRVVALALASVNEDDWPALGYSNAYIDLIAVVRSHRGRKLAPATVTALLRAIAGEGLQRAALDVDTDSPTGANRLYTALGFTATDRSLALVSRY